MKTTQFEATDSCRPLTAELFTDEDIRSLVGEYAQQIANGLNSFYIAHNIRGQHRATNKQGEFLRAEDHLYSVLDCLKGTSAMRGGEPSKEDVAMAERLNKAITARVENGEYYKDVEEAVVKFHASLTPGWTYDESMEAGDCLARYCRAYRLYKAAKEKATTFK